MALSKCSKKDTRTTLKISGLVSMYENDFLIYFAEQNEAERIRTEGTGTEGTGTKSNRTDLNIKGTLLEFIYLVM